MQAMNKFIQQHHVPEDSSNNNNNNVANQREKFALMEQMINRLNNALARSQNSHLPAEDLYSDGDAATDTLHSRWQCDPKIVFPLIREYDQKIDDLTANNELLSRKNEEYQERIKELLGANEVLYNELKTSVQDHICSHHKTNENVTHNGVAQQLQKVKEKLAEISERANNFAQNSMVCDSINEDFVSSLNNAIAEHKSEMKRQDYESQMKVLTRKITKLTQRNEDVRNKCLLFAKENEQVCHQLTQSLSQGDHQSTKMLVQKFQKLTSENQANALQIQDMEKENVLLVREVESSAVDLNIATAAYNEEVEKMSDRVSALGRKHEKLRTSAKEVRRESSNLISDMKQVATDLVDAFHSYGKLNETSPDNDEAIANLTRQLELCTEEKDWAIQLQEDTMQELDNFRRGLLSDNVENQRKDDMYYQLQTRNKELEKSSLRCNKDVKILKRENENLSFAVTRQFDDINCLKQEVRKNKDMASMYGKREHDVLEIAEQLKMRVLKLEDEKGETEHRIEMSAQTIAQLQEALCEAESKLSIEVQKNNKSCQEMKSLQQRVTALQQAKLENETKEFQYLSQIREGAQLLDEACLSRDAAIVREKQLQEDLCKASEAMEKMVGNVACRIQQEVNKYKIQAKEKVDRLMDEIETMTIEAANLKSEVNRARRSFRTAECELEDLQRKLRDTEDPGQLAEFQRRTIAAERAKEDMEVTLESFECQYKQRIRDYEDEKSNMLCKQQTLEDKICKLKNEVARISEENLELLEEVDRSKTRVLKNEYEARMCGLEATKKLAVDRSIIQRNNKLLENRIKNLNEQNTETTRHFRKLVNDQQRISARWKEEASSVSEKYDRQICDLQEKLNINRKRCQDLTIQLENSRGNLNFIDDLHREDSTKENQEFDSTIQELELRNQELRQRLHESDMKLLSATARMGESSKNNESLCLYDYK